MNDVTELLSDLIAADTMNPSGNETVAARTLAAWLAARGIESVIEEIAPGRGNLIARVSSGRPGPTVMFNSHLDVVPAGDGWRYDPRVATVVDGRLFGRGAADAKGSIAAMAAAMARVLMRGGPRSGELVLAAVADEEVGSKGTRTLLQRRRPDAAIVGEPTSLRLLTAHKGSVRPVIEVTGLPAHAATPQRGRNAIRGMSELLGLIDGLALELAERVHPLVGAPTVTPVLISGGEAPNMVPEHCRVTLDRRLIPGESAESALQEIDRLLAEFNARFAPLGAHVVECAPSTGGASETDAGHPFVVACREALAAIGQDGDLGGLVVNCDMTHFRAAGVPCLVYGPGELEVMHAIDEWVSVTALDQAVEGYVAIAGKLLAGDGTWTS